MHELDFEESAQRTLGTLRVLALAFVAGMVLFGLIATFVVQSEERAMDSLGWCLVALGAGLAVAGPGIATTLLRKSLGSLDTSPGRKEILEAYQASKIVGYAVTDAGGLLGPILIVLSGQVFYGGILVALAVLILLKSLPSRGELDELLRQAGA